MKGVNMNTNMNTNNNIHNNYKSKVNWELISDCNKYNQELKLDDKNYPLTEKFPQEEYSVYEPYDIFSLFFTKELIHKIVNSTNEFINDEIENSKKTRSKDFRDLSYNEFLIYIGMKLYFNFMNSNNLKGKLVI